MYVSVYVSVCVCVACPVAIITSCNSERYAVYCMETIYSPCFFSPRLFSEEKN